MKTGYRRYDIDAKTVREDLSYKEKIPLVGATRHAWESRTETAECARVGNGRLSTASKVVALNHLSNDECSCGIYVAKKPDWGFDYTTHPVIAAVSAWGAYIEYEMGWRFEHVRLEHLWIESKKLYTKVPDIVTVIAQSLSETYGVGVDIKTDNTAWCCGRDHPIDYWQSKDGRSLTVCQMETSHIANALRWLKLTNPEIPRIGTDIRGKPYPPYRKSHWAAQWIATFEAELAYRAPQIVDGKPKVVF